MERGSLSALRERRTERGRAEVDAAALTALAAYLHHPTPQLSEFRHANPLKEIPNTEADDAITLHLAIGTRTKNCPSNGRAATCPLAELQLSTAGDFLVPTFRVATVGSVKRTEMMGLSFRATRRDAYPETSR